MTQQKGFEVQLSLTDRTYLVTGGGSGIGKGVAAALVDRGRSRDDHRAECGQAGRGGDRHTTHARAGGGAVRYEPTDVTEEDEVANAVEAATAWSGRLHGAVHCAGGSETIGPITQIDSGAWRRTVDLNVNGTMYVLKHAARELVRGGGGSFVAISSIAASNTHRWFGAYGPTKSAIDHLMKVAADELGRSWVRFNAIRPGLVRTDLVEPIMPDPRRQRGLPINTPLPARRRGRGRRQSFAVPAQRCG